MSEAITRETRFVKRSLWFSSASESASEKSSGELLMGSCWFFPSWAECLTGALKCLILLVFDSYAQRASGGEPIVQE
jgi:hypothetical protein